MRELLLRGGAVNAQTNNGATPLTCACENGQLTTAILLLDASADLALLSNGGHSALFYAERRKAADAAPPAAGAAPPTAAQVAEHKALVALLKERGA
jgi:ankyrin repeat protein